MTNHAGRASFISGKVLMLIILTCKLNGITAWGQTVADRPEVVITGLQMQVTNDIDINLRQILEGLQKAADESADFLVTPEGSLSGYNSSFNQDEVTKALERLTAAARHLNIGVLLGTCYKETIKGKEYCYNQVRVYSPSGKFEGAYSKI